MPMRTRLKAWREKGGYFTFRGFKIFYRMEGEGPALLLIHGYPTSSYDWKGLWPDLTSRFTVVAPDMLGMGFSSKPWRWNYKPHYTIASHWEMHEALMLHLELPEFHMLSHDIGVSVAQELLARMFEADRRQQAYPVRALTSAFLNGGLFAEVYKPRPIQNLLSSPLGHLAGPMVGRSKFWPAMKEMFGPGTQPTDDELEDFYRLVMGMGGRFTVHLSGRFWHDRAPNRDRWVEGMKRSGVPLRMINGPLDPNSGKHMAERYREVIPDPDIVSLPRIGHWPAVEAPRAVADALIEFIARHDTRIAG